MNFTTTLVLFVVIGVIGMVVSLLLIIPYAFKNTAETRLNRLSKEEALETSKRTTDRVNPFVKFLEQNFAPLARFSNAEKVSGDDSPLRKKLVTAGFYDKKAVGIFLGVKTVSSLSFPALALIITTIVNSSIAGTTLLGIMVGMAAIGYMLPNIILDTIKKRRSEDLYRIFPDVLDLMRISVEAGLSLDMAIAKVRDEIGIRSRAMADEFNIVSLEQRAGASRNMSLNNFAKRINIPDVDSFVSALVQADRYGTSVSDTLRVHSETLRHARRMKAEEAAAKISSKILMPLVFCIFPLIFVVILGPAVHQIVQGFSGAKDGSSADSSSDDASSSDASSSDTSSSDASSSDASSSDTSSSDSSSSEASSNN